MKQVLVLPRLAILAFAVVMLAGGAAAVWQAYDSSPTTRAKRQLCLLAEAYRDHPRTPGKFPHELDFMHFANSRRPQRDVTLVDPWETRIAYCDKGGIFTSAGPDKVFGSPDDLFICAYNHRAESGSIPLSAVMRPEAPSEPVGWRMVALGECLALLLLAAAVRVWRRWRRREVGPWVQRSGFGVYSLLVGAMGFVSAAVNFGAIYEHVSPELWLAFLPVSGPPLAIAIPAQWYDPGRDTLWPARGGYPVSTFMVLLTLSVTYYALVLASVLRREADETGARGRRWRRVTAVVVLHLFLMVVSYEYVGPKMSALQWWR